MYYAYKWWAENNYTVRPEDIIRITLHTVIALGLWVNNLTEHRRRSFPRATPTGRGVSEESRGNGVSCRVIIIVIVVVGTRKALFVSALLLLPFSFFYGAIVIIRKSIRGARHTRARIQDRKFPSTLKHPVARFILNQWGMYYATHTTRAHTRNIVFNELAKLGKPS